MLIQFSLRNYLSFRDESVFDMTAMEQFSARPQDVMETPAGDILKVAAIYGANASGKSNLFQAFSAFRDFVFGSMARRPEEGGPLELLYAPYRLRSRVEPASFQVVLFSHGEELRYGFSFTERSIVKEWLYRGEEMVFARDVKEGRCALADDLPDRSFADQLARHLPHRVLFATASATFFPNGVCAHLLEALEGHVFLGADIRSDAASLKSVLHRDMREAPEDLRRYLEALGAGICDITLDHHTGRIRVIHAGEDGGSYALDVEDESEGVRKAMMLYGYAGKAIQNGGTLWIDELNVKLHPLLMKFVVDLFQAPGVRAQLIYTTHDTMLLDRRYLRRDEVWFVEKDEKGCSKLVSLAEFQPEMGKDLWSNYLAGVYGGIPHLKDFRFDEHRQENKTEGQQP